MSTFSVLPPTAVPPCGGEGAPASRWCDEEEFPAVCFSGSDPWQPTDRLLPALNCTPLSLTDSVTILTHRSLRSWLIHVWVVFVYALFNDVLCSSDFLRPIIWWLWLMNCKKRRRKRSWPNLRFYSGISWGTETLHETHQLGELVAGSRFQATNSRMRK